MLEELAAEVAGLLAQLAVGARERQALEDERDEENGMPLKPSPTKRLYTSILRIEDIRNEGEDKIVEIVVVNWNPHIIIQVPISFFPDELRENLDPDIQLLAKVNIAAKDVEDLIFEDIELAPEIE